MPHQQPTFTVFWRSNHDLNQARAIIRPHTCKPCDVNNTMGRRRYESLVQTLPDHMASHCKSAGWPQVWVDLGTESEEYIGSLEEVHGWLQRNRSGWQCDDNEDPPDYYCYETIA